MATFTKGKRHAFGARRLVTLATVFAIMMAILFAARPSEAYALDLNRSNYLVGVSTKAKTKAPQLARKVGAKRRRATKQYSTYFATGKKIAIGVDVNAISLNPCYAIRNGGNKSVSILGVKIGMSKTVAVKKLKAKGWTTYDNKFFWYGSEFGNQERIVLTCKKGKVSAFRYTAHKDMFIG